MTTLVASYTPGANRSNFTGYQGVRFTVTGSNITVNTLGIRVATGNIANKNVYILNNANTVLASATINITGVVPVGTFVYASISPITLTVGTVYNLVCQTTSGGENWSDTGAVTLNGAGTVFSIWSASLGSFTQQVSGQMYIGVDLNGTPPTPQDQLPVWRQWPQQRYPNAYDDPQLNIDENDNRISLPWLRRNQVTTWKITNAAVNVSKFVQYDALAQPDTAVSIAKFASYNVIETIPPIPSNVYSIRRQMLVAWDEIEQDEVLNSFHLLHSRKQTATTAVNITLTLTGVASSSGIGTFSESISKSITAPGVGSSGQAGSFVSKITVALTGVSGTGEITNVVPIIGKDAFITGVASAALAGTQTTSIQFSFIGVGATANIGIPQAANIVLITGVSSAAHIGTPTVLTVSFVRITGVASPANVGTFGISETFILASLDSPVEIGNLIVHANQGNMRMTNFIVETIPGPIIDKQINLRWSDTSGMSFNQPVQKTLDTGNYAQSLSFRRLSYARDRVFELSWSIPSLIVLEGAWIEVEDGKT